MSYVDVSDLDDDFTNSGEDFDSPVPDDEYCAEVSGTEFVWIPSKPPQRAFKWKFLIVDGEHQGRTVEKTALLRKDLLKWLRMDLNRFGVTFGNLTDLQQHQRDLWGLRINLKLTTKADKNGRDRQNVWLLKVGNSPPVSTDRYEPPPPEDEIPF